MLGTLTSQVCVDLDDCVVGGPDGAIVVPSAIAMQALVKAEEIERLGEYGRDLVAGMSFEEALEKWARA